jgi:hypothetical protein
MRKKSKGCQARLRPQSLKREQKKRWFRNDPQMANRMRGTHQCRQARSAADKQTARRKLKTRHFAALRGE